jgi:hypothetical protein
MAVWRKAHSHLWRIIRQSHPSAAGQRGARSSRKAQLRKNPGNGRRAARRGRAAALSVTQEKPLRCHGTRRAGSTHEAQL